jgi:predicted nucleotidyltransferase
VVPKGGLAPSGLTREEMGSYTWRVRPEQVRELLRPILERKGARLAILFGSCARGTDDARSDVDLIIVDNQPLRYLDRIGKYHDDIRSALHREVDIFVYTEEEFLQMQEGHFVGRAMDEGRVVYERGKAVA